MEVTLMNKDIPVLKGEIDENISVNELNIPVIVFTSFEYLNPALCPVAVFMPSDEGGISQLNSWFSKRHFSNKRDDFPKENVEWQGVPHFFSLSDQYWIKYTTEEWKHLNFFTNDFSKSCGDVIFSKNLHNIETLKVDYDSPEITTNGILKKRWDKEGARTVLIKHMSKDFSQEPLSEIMATKLLKRLNIIPFVPYSLYIDGYDLCSKCNNFCTPSAEFVPASAVYAATPIDENEKGLSEPDKIYMHIKNAIKFHNIPHAEDFIDKMIMADRYILNYDRHLGNFGFLRDVETGEYFGPAPLFDFGNAFSTYNEGIVSKCFATREDYLFKNQKIPPLDEAIIEAFKEDIRKTSLLNEIQKKQIVSNIELNSRYIRLNAKEEFRGKNYDERERIIQSAEVDF